MKKLYKVLLILIVALSSCNPMNDIYTQLDKEVQPPKATFNYTLADGDYSAISSAALKDAITTNDTLMAKSIASTNSLPEGYAEKYVPAVIQALHPSLGKGSSADVTYNYNNGYKTDIVGSYTLSAADYESFGGAVAVYKYFSPSNAPEDYLPDFLSAKFSTAADGTYEFVTYEYSTTDPQVGEVTVFGDDFSNGLDNFDTVSVVGDQKWYGSSYNSDYFAKISGYSGGAQDNEDWLISPAINLSGYTDAKIEVSQAAKYLNDQWDQIQVLISTDYSGDVTTATWTPVTIDTLPSGSDYTFVSSGKVDISAYDGMTIHVAFKYLSTTTNAATWEINYLKIYGTVPGKVSVDNGGPVATTALYKLSGTTWGEVSTSDYYMLTADDYNAMGSPGKYDNFSSSDNPDDYLPQFLTMKYPYAQEGDQEFIIYKYYSSGSTKTQGDLYTFSGGVWVKYSAVVQKSAQFVSVGDYWIFDPTVRHTMVSADYQMIVDYVKADPDLKQYVDSYGTAESYYGASGYYNEFNGLVAQHTDPAFDGLTQTEAEALVQQRVKEGIIIFLKAKYPNAVAQVSGVDVMYEITYTFYTGGTPVNYTSTFQCTKSGPSPEFTFSSGPEPAK